MNTTSFFAGLFLFVLIIANGQTNKAEVGIEAGPSVIYLRGNTTLETINKPTAGFSGALFFQYNAGKVLAFRTNIAFERKGSVAKYYVTDMNGSLLGEVTTHVNFNYLTIPVLLRASFGNKTKFFINAGPYMGILLSQTDVTPTVTSPSNKTKNTEAFNPLDLGASIGAGLLIPVKDKWNFSFEIRNNTGYYNVSKAPIYGGGTIKTSSTNFLLGLAYKL